MDTCDEQTKTCTHTAVGDCAMCSHADCTADCHLKSCGSDGCGGSCGTCASGKACSATGTCTLANALGTCAKPRPLAVRLGANNTQVISGDTTTSVSQLTPTCTAVGTAVEDVYSFTITAPTGIEATTQEVTTSNNTSVVPVHIPPA